MVGANCSSTIIPTFKESSNKGKSNVMTPFSSRKMDLLFGVKFQNPSLMEKPSRKKEAITMMDNGRIT